MLHCADVQAERAGMEGQEAGGLSLDVDMAIQVEEGSNVQDGGLDSQVEQDAQAVEPQPAIMLSLAGWL